MTSELGRRLAFTVGALLVYRLGSYIPLPGIDAAVLAQVFRSQAGGISGLVQASSSSFHRLAIFAVGITPYLTAAILLQLLSMALPPLKALSVQGARGRRRLHDYTLGLTIALSVLQGLGLAFAIESIPSLVPDPGWVTRIMMTLSFAGGTLFLVWLSAQITARGLGNGIALILLIGIVIELPSAMARTLELGRQGAVSMNLIYGLSALAVAMTGVIVVVELAQRRLTVEYPRWRVGTRVIEGRSVLPVKLNAAGIIPALLASYFLFIPVTLASYVGEEGPRWLIDLSKQLGHGQPLYLVVYALLIVLFALIYSAFVLDPERVAGELERTGGAIPGVVPGEATAAHVDNVLTRTTILGAVYLALVCVVPEILIAYSQVPFYFGGTSLLVVVCAILDIDAQLRGRAV